MGARASSAFSIVLTTPNRTLPFAIISPRKRIVGACGILVIVLVLYGVFSLIWWFLAPIVWKFHADPFEGAEENKGA